MAPLEALPIEMVWKIASFLDSGHDFIAFHQSCSHVLQCTTPHQVIWRREFLKKYDSPDRGQNRASNSELYKLYRLRNHYLKPTIDFAKIGEREARRKILTVQHLIFLILDSITDERGLSFNIHFLRHYCKRSNFLTTLFNASITARFLNNNDRSVTAMVDPVNSNRFLFPYCVLASVLFPFTLSGHDNISSQSQSASHNRLRWPNTGFAIFPESQRMMYSNEASVPLWRNSNRLQVTALWLMHATVFWRYHLVTDQPTTLYNSYNDLPRVQRIRCWDKQLVHLAKALPIGKDWLGIYSSLRPTDYANLQRSGWDGVVEDHFPLDAQGLPEILRYHFTWISDRQQVYWPTRFQQAVPRACNSTYEMTAQHFKVEGRRRRGTPNFEARGWLSLLPAQAQIEGWQRFVMVNFERNQFGNVVLDNSFAHEGIVLPGGKVVLGRYWNIFDDQGNGQRCYPFILWNGDILTFPSKT